MRKDDFVRISVNHRVWTYSVGEDSSQYFAVRTPGLWNEHRKTRWQAAGGAAHILVPGVREFLSQRFGAKDFEGKDARFKVPKENLEPVLYFFRRLDSIEKKPRREWREELVDGELEGFPPALSSDKGVEFIYRGWCLQPEREGGYSKSRHGVPTRCLDHVFHAKVQPWLYDELSRANEQRIIRFMTEEEVRLTRGGRRRAPLRVLRLGKEQRVLEEIADNLYIPDEPPCIEADQLALSFG